MRSVPPLTLLAKWVETNFYEALDNELLNDDLYQY